MAPALSPTRTLAYNLYGSQTAAYSIGGYGSVEKAGHGLLTLTTTNNYTGGTTVNGGTLSLNHGADGTGIGNIVGTLTINQGGTVVLGATAFGYLNAATTLSALNINGGLLDKAVGAGTDQTLTGVTVTMTGGTWAGTGGFYDMSHPAIPYGDLNDSVTVVASGATAYSRRRSISARQPLVRRRRRHDAVGRRSSGQRAVDQRQPRRLWHHQGRTRRHGADLFQQHL